MHFTIVVPGLLDWPLVALAAVEKEAPALARLLAAAPSPTIEEDGLVATACRYCGISKQQDWPVAPWLARAAGLDTDGAYWLCDDGIRFFAPEPARWFARVEHAPRLVTFPPEAALGAPLVPYLAAGPDAARWRRWQSEMQMLLFEHAVNFSREQSGRAAVDSVWLWGGGALVPRDAPAVQIFGFEDSQPTLLAYQRALARSPEELDASLNKHALVAPESNLELVPLGPFNRSDAALHDLLGDD